MTSTTLAAMIKDPAYWELEGTFLAFCNFGERQNGMIGRMDRAQFAKLCRDTNIVGRTVPLAKADIVFNKHAQGRHRIPYYRFVAAIQDMAELRFPHMGTAVAMKSSSSSWARLTAHYRLAQRHPKTSS